MGAVTKTTANHNTHTQNQQVTTPSTSHFLLNKEHKKSKNMRDKQPLEKSIWKSI